MSTTAENKNRITAMALTIAFHAVLFLLFILIVFITPIPPFEIKPSPEIEIGLGMEGFGDMDAGGSGKNDTDIKTTETDASVPQETHPDAVNVSAPAIITDPTEEVVSVKTNPKNTTKQQVTETPPKEVEPKPSPELLNALNALKNKKKHLGDGKGTGDTGGSGNGTAQGVGDGDGMGHGDGTPGYNGSGNNYDLKGRKLIKKPEQMTDSQEEGTVVVEIIVDETGRVIKATPGQRGSTTTSSNLFAKARQAALSAKFNPSPEGIKEQRGTYSFVFVLE
jgi:periplasmic protein TonB